MLVPQKDTICLAGDFLEIRISRAVIVLVVKTGEGSINVLKRYVMFFASNPGTKMDHPSFVKFKVNNRSPTQITNMSTCQWLFAVHAGERDYLILDQLKRALLVEATIRGTKVYNPLLFVLFNPHFYTGTAIKIEGIIHQRFFAVWTFNLQRNQVLCHKYLLW
jgi:hypothetical protein